MIHLNAKLDRETAKELLACMHNWIRDFGAEVPENFVSLQNLLREVLIEPEALSAEINFTSKN